MIRHTVFAGVLFVSGLAAPQSALADAAGEALVSDLVNSLAAASDWNATSNVVRSDGNSVIVEGLSFANTQNSITVSIDSIEFTGLSGRGDGYAAEKAAVRGMTVSYDLIKLMQSDATANAQASMINTVTVETMDVTDLFLPGAATAGADDKPDGILAPLIAIYGYLAKVEMSSAMVPLIANEQVISGGDTGSEQTSLITYRDSRISGWRDGILSRMEIGRMDMSISGGESGEVAVSAESSFAEHFDLAHYIHVLDAAQFKNGRGDGVWKTVLRQIEYSGIRVNVDKADIRVAKIVAADFAMRQTEKPFLTGIDDLLEIAASGREPDEEEALALVGDIMPNLFGAMRVGLLQMEGTTIRSVVSSDPGSFSMENFTIAGLSSGGIDRFSIDGIEVTGPDNVTVKLDTFGFGGLTLPDWEVAQQFIDAAARGDDIEKNPELMSRILDLYPSIDTFSMRGLSGNAPGKETFRIEEIVLDVTDRVAGLMIAGRGSVRGVEFPASYFDNSGSPNPLRMLGYDRLVMDYVFDSDLDKASTTLQSNAVLKVRDAGDLEIDYGITGVSDAEIRRIFNRIVELEASGQGEDPAQIMELLDNLGFNGFSISFSDRSIVSRALRIAAEQQGTDAATYGQQLKAAIPFFMSTIPPGKFRDEAAEAAQATLDGGQKTTFSLSPGRTVMIPEIIIAGMQDPLSLITLLGASASTEPVN